REQADDALRLSLGCAAGRPWRERASRLVVGGSDRRPRSGRRCIPRGPLRLAWQGRCLLCAARPRWRVALDGAPLRGRLLRVTLPVAVRTRRVYEARASRVRSVMTAVAKG